MIHAHPLKHRVVDIFTFCSNVPDVASLESRLAPESAGKSPRILASHRSAFHFTTPSLLPIGQAPQIVISPIPSDVPPAGLGELIAAVAPAITNAIYAATGTRIRQLPLQASGIIIV